MSKSLRGDLLKQLVRSHADRDEEAFRKAALQVAAAESEAGHIRVAEELRALVAHLPPPSAAPASLVDIAQPRGALADILEGGHRPERLRDIVLPLDTQQELERLLLENRSRARLQSFGVAPRRRLLFHGPPGCGKTLAAAVMAGELGVPLMTVRFDALFSRFLGATATHLRAIFSEMPRRPGVYLFDEFDAVAKARGASHDVGEMQRIVTAFLQLVDADRSPSILIAATNHSELLDRAVFRRFDLIVHFDRPDEPQILALLTLRLAAFDLGGPLLRRLSRLARGLSFADVARACDDAIRSMALGGRDRPADSDLRTAFNRAKAAARRKGARLARSRA
jgi:SpoVK/Ycf46/Vps4 family AAA+-type ATPase